MTRKDLIQALETYFEKYEEEEIDITEFAEALLFEEPSTYEELITTLEENVI